MSSDTILRDEDGGAWSLDNLTTNSYLLGHVGGAERVAAWLAELSVELFRNAKDTEAVALRKLSQTVLSELVPEFREAAKRHEKENPPKIGDGS